MLKVWLGMTAQKSQQFISTKGYFFFTFLLNCFSFFFTFLYFFYPGNMSNMTMKKVDILVQISIHKKKKLKCKNRQEKLNSQQYLHRKKVLNKSILKVREN